MIPSMPSRLMSELIRKNKGTIFPEILTSVQNSIVNVSDERVFIQKLGSELEQRLTAVKIPGLQFTFRIARIHAEPIVSTPSYDRELGDLLFVVKYHPMQSPIERKAIIYQVKLTQKPTSNICTIDTKQLDLLTTWPQFSFGRKADGGPRYYKIDPFTKEFGSYMLEPRAPAPSPPPLGPYRYGICMTACAVFSQGPRRINIGRSTYVFPEAYAIFDQLLFDIGEPLISHEVIELVSALYRYVRLDPDPPTEFDLPPKNESEGMGNFNVIECNVVQTEEGSG